jgi:uncharacterized protein (DUF885 family)
MRTLRLLCVVALLCFVLACSGTSDTPNATELRFSELSAEYVEWHLADGPVRATGLGIHDFDSQWPTVDAASMSARSEALQAWLSRLEEIPRDQLRGDAYLDHRVLEYGLRAALLEIDEVHSWKSNPNFYNQIAARGISSLTDREFAPTAERVESIIERLSTVAPIFEAAQINLDDVPPIWVDLALGNVAGTQRFLKNDLLVALRSQGLTELEATTQERLNRAIEDATQLLAGFESWLRDDLKPRAQGDFRLGADLYRRKLLYEEHIDLTVAELKSINEQSILDYQDWVAREAKSIDAKETPAQVMERITSSFPANEMLVPTAARFVAEAKELVIEREIVTLPADTLPTIRPTPEFARSGFASMSTPGPFEKVATEAYYNITTVDPTWSEKQQREHLTYFNYPGLLGISIHEVMPGHYVQLLYQKQIPGDIRKLFAPGTLVEGWAHYTEQMMVDEGVGDGISSVRLGQLRRALQRHARWQAAVAMHVDGASVRDAAIQFGETAYFADFPALRETQRGTYDPMFLVYALGRIEIFRLRQDYRSAVEARGELFSLRDFHDQLLRLGLPLPLAREALIPQ